MGSGFLWYLRCWEINSLLFLFWLEPVASAFLPAGITELANSNYCTNSRQLLIDLSAEHLFWLQMYKHYTAENRWCFQFQGQLGHFLAVKKSLITDLQHVCKPSTTGLSQQYCDNVFFLCARDTVFGQGASWGNGYRVAPSRPLEAANSQWPFAFWVSVDRAVWNGKWRIMQIYKRFMKWKEVAFPDVLTIHKKYSLLQKNWCSDWWTSHTWEWKIIGCMTVPLGKA